MHLDRRFVNVGALLVVLGGVPLLVQLGALDAAQLADAWRLWPVLLILAGICLILARTRVRAIAGPLCAVTIGLIGGALLALGGPGVAIGCGGSGGPAFTPSSGTFGGNPAAIQLTMVCGDLRTSTSPGAGWALSGVSSDGAAPLVSSGRSSLEIHANHGVDAFGIGGRRSAWNLVLPTGPALDLGVTVSAGTGQLDLSGANVSSLDFTENAGSTRVDGSGAASIATLSATVNAGNLLIALPNASAQGSLTVNAGHLGLCVPAGAGLRIQTSGALGSNNLAAHGLVDGGGVWTTPGYDSAAVRIDLDATINAGNLELDPSGGCS